MKAKVTLAISLMTTMALALCLAGCDGSPHTYTGHNKGTKNAIAQEAATALRADELEKHRDACGRVDIVIRGHYDYFSEYDSLEFESYSFIESDFDSYPYSFSGTVTLRDEFGEEWISEWRMQIRFDGDSGNAVPVKGSEFFGEPYRA